MTTALSHRTCTWVSFERDHMVGTSTSGSRIVTIVVAFDRPSWIGREAMFDSQADVWSAKPKAKRPVREPGSGWIAALSNGWSSRVRRAVGDGKLRDHRAVDGV